MTLAGAGGSPTAKKAEQEKEPEAVEIEADTISRAFDFLSTL